MAIGSSSSLWFPDWLINVCNGLIDGAPPAVAPVAWDGLIETNRAAGRFALYVGPQHLHPWTGANVAVLVPSFADTDTALMQFRGDAYPLAKPLEAVNMGIDVHIWGEQPSPDAPYFNTILWDIERYRPACEIYQNVVRVLSCMASGFQTQTSLTGWANDTDILRYGESIAFSWRTSFVVSDFPDTAAPTPLSLLADAGQPVIVRPDEA